MGGEATPLLRFLLAINYSKQTNLELGLRLLRQSPSVAPHSPPRARVRPLLRRRRQPACLPTSLDAGRYPTLTL
jgi:hypothetical protein